MMKRLSLYLFLVLSFLVSPAFGQNATLIKEGFIAHGVGTSVSSLIAFLEKGWDAAHPPAKMPDVPVAKTTLLVDAWQYLALHYTEVKANSIYGFQLSGLARRYALGQFPPAIEKMIAADIEEGDPVRQTEKRNALVELLRYNGMIALGIFGEPSPALIRDARTVYEAEKRPIIRVQYATTLALLGDATAVEDLVNEAAKANSDSSVAAARSLSTLFGRSFGMTPVTAAEPRKQDAEEIKRWWQENSSRAKVNREAAIMRQLNRPELPPYPLRNLRELLRASADENDMSDLRGSRTAWNRLQDMQKNNSEDLLKAIEPIVKDQREDLDIRDQAIRWYVRIREEKAKGMLKKLRKDPNPEIAALAQKYLESFDKEK